MTEARQDNSASRWLLLPMEIVEREMPERLLLAAEAVKQGWQCVIGTKKAVFQVADTLPDGAVFLKSLISSETERVQMLKDAGHTVVSLDAEGLVQNSETDFVSRYADTTLERTEKAFLWGKAQQDILAKAYPDHAEKFKVTGSPVVDLWQHHAGYLYGEKAKEYKEKHGSFIFIPSSFGVPNHFMGPDAVIEIMRLDNMFMSEDHLHYLEDYVEHTGKVFTRFLDMIPQLAKAYPDKTIIIRPHPSGSFKRWEEAAKGEPNVKVVFEGTVTPWLMAADSVVLWGSTTAIETRLMKKPVVVFFPKDLAEEAKPYAMLPHRAGVLADDAQDTVAKVGEVLADVAAFEKKYAKRLEEGDTELVRWMDNMGNHTDAAKQIMAELTTLELAEHKLSDMPEIKEPPLGWKEIVYRMIEAVDAIPGVGKLFPKPLRWRLDARAYGRSKTKDIDGAELTRMFDHLLKQGEGEGGTVTPLAKNLFMLGRK